MAAAAGTVAAPTKGRRQRGAQAWCISLTQDEPLVRPYKNYKVIGDVSGASIARPSTFIEKING